jgi:hypothetical protein
MATTAADPEATQPFLSPPTWGTDVRHPGIAAESARLVSAVYFVTMALGVNAAYLLRHPEDYDKLTDVAVLPPYKWLLRDVIRPRASRFTLLLIAFELTVALLLLGKGRAVKLGLVAAIAFQLAVIPGVAAYGLVNLPVVAVQALLLRQNFDRSGLDVVRGRHRPGHTDRNR